MNSSWQANRKSNSWSGGIAEWIEDNTAYLSVVFSWNTQKAHERAVWLKAQGYHVRAGGPALALNGDILAEVAELGGDGVDALSRHNPQATFTTRGCIRKCPFCVVPKYEGSKLIELDDWPIRPVVCDNNFLASSRKHFDSVIDKLKPLKDIDFNQGLDARLVKSYHAQRIAELKMKCVRLAWDDIKIESQFMAAFEILTSAGIKPSMIHSYILIGYNDTPTDALYRLQKVADLGAWPNPMRYQPLDSKKRNEYIGPNWTDAELKRFMRYWANLRVTRKVPFDEFRNRGQEPSKPISDMQLQLL